MHRVLYCLLTIGCSAAWAQKPPTPDPLEIVDCRTLEGLSRAILNDLGAHVRCRLEPGNLTCLPGARLKVDVTEKLDLCVRDDGRPIHSPHCVGRPAKTYNQRIIERARHRVETRGIIEYRWLDLPFGMASQIESLAQRKPIIRIGPDACVFLRKEAIFMTRPGRPAMPTPKAEPPRPPAP
jgi:hypothetical protein